MRAIDVRMKCSEARRVAEKWLVEQRDKIDKGEKIILRNDPLYVALFDKVTEARLHIIYCDECNAWYDRICKALFGTGEKYWDARKVY